MLSPRIMNRRLLLRRGSWVLQYGTLFRYRLLARLFGWHLWLVEINR